MWLFLVSCGEELESLRRRLWTTSAPAGPPRDAVGVAQHQHVLATFDLDRDDRRLLADLDSRATNLDGIAEPVRSASCDSRYQSGPRWTSTLSVLVFSIRCTPTPMPLIGVISASDVIVPLTVATVLESNSRPYAPSAAQPRSLSSRTTWCRGRRRSKPRPTSPRNVVRIALRVRHDDDLSQWSRRRSREPLLPRRRDLECIPALLE